MSSTLETAKNVVKAEIEGLNKFLGSVDSNFAGAVEAILKSKGRLIVTGLGKSGLIAGKMAATFSSTGTPSAFIHPTEAYHGDLGLIKKEDVILAISKSGQTEEVIRLIPFFKENGNKLISISSNTSSKLAEHSDFHISMGTVEEACPLKLAPTTSTTITLVAGDALAVALMEAKNFKSENFAKFHPGGSLGFKLLTKVKDVMRKNNLPVLSEDQKVFPNLIEKMTMGKLGLCLVVNAEGELTGLVTDGDLRRAMAKFSDKLLTLTAREIMTQNPKTIAGDLSLQDAEKLMVDSKITGLVCVDGTKPTGILQIYDIRK